MFCELYSFQPNLAVYGNLANVRKGLDTEAPPPLPAYRVDKPPPRSVIKVLTDVPSYLS